MTLEEKFNGLKKAQFNEHQTLLERGYGERFITMMARDGYATGCEHEESFDVFGKYVRINKNCQDLRINLMLSYGEGMKYVLTSYSGGPAIYAFNDRHANIRHEMRKEMGELDDDNLAGGLMELAFDDADKPYICVYGKSGDYGSADHHKTVNLLRSVGLEAKVDETRAQYTQS